MEEGELHGLHKSLSLSKPHIRNPTIIPSMGLLRAPPSSLPHSHRQPPLLPLPATHLHRSASALGPAYSQPANKSCNTHKKSKCPSKAPRKEEKKISRRSSDSVTVSSTSDLGSVELPISVAKEGCNWMTISPPPSSLPLPTFTLRRKLGCNGGEDTGASDDLRRLLRLQ